MSAADRAFKLLAGSGTLVVIDVETCPSPTGDRIIAIAAATCREGRQRSLWSKVINPGVPITNSQFHGLTDADVANAVTFPEVIAELDALLAEPDTFVVCHNTRFDISRLHAEYDRAGVAFGDLPLLDTMLLPAALNYPLATRSRRLAALCDHFSITNRSPHDPSSDATATALVAHALLRFAAAHGLLSLTAVHAQAGAPRTTGIAADTTGITNRPATDGIPEAHLATHTTLLPTKATTRDLNAWVAGALECVELRCPLLADKARTAQPHASVLHPRLTEALTDSTFEPGQGATLLGALNLLARNGIVKKSTPRPFKTWWEKNRPVVQALPRCDDEHGQCPECSAGEPCPIDVAYHVLCEAFWCEDDGTITTEHRKKIAGSSKFCALNNWPILDLIDMAGYSAWLAADAWLQDGNPGRAERVVAKALDAGCLDPRIIRLQVERLEVLRRHSEVDQLITTNMVRRTTDPGWDELDGWHQRALAQRIVRTDRPTKPSSLPRLARPRSRRRHNPFMPRR